MGNNICSCLLVIIPELEKINIVGNTFVYSFKILRIYIVVRIYEENIFTCSILQTYLPCFSRAAVVGVNESHPF